MRFIFLISAVLLHMSWCYEFPGPWFPGNFFPGFLDRYKIEDEIKPLMDKINALSDIQSSKPGVPIVSGTPGGVPGQFFSSVSHSSVVSDTNGEVHKEGETIVNNNGKITKYKL